MKNVKQDIIKYGDAEGYFTWNTEGEGKWPLILYVHGGPHGNFYSNSFTFTESIWYKLGYSVLKVNFRGSTGYGLKFLESLQGKAGILDVEDCGEILLKTLNEFKDEIDETWIGVYGGSHGGFLTCWLAGHEKYSKLFKAAILWNPVTDFHASNVFTDIHDWNNAEALG